MFWHLSSVLLSTFVQPLTDVTNHWSHGILQTSTICLTIISTLKRVEALARPLESVGIWTDVEDFLWWHNRQRYVKSVGKMLITSVSSFSFYRRYCNAMQCHRNSDSYLSHYIVKACETCVHRHCWVCGGRTMTSIATSYEMNFLGKHCLLSADDKHRSEFRRINHRKMKNGANGLR